MPRRATVTTEPNTPVPNPTPSLTTRRRFLAAGLGLATTDQWKASAQGQSRPPSGSTLRRGVIHVFVALCDNASQGIQPVPPKIGNGDDPAANLYWGCSDGVKAWMSRATGWVRETTTVPASLNAVVLERASFLHVRSGTQLIADAYRGREIKRAISDYVGTLAGSYQAEASSSPPKGKSSSSSPEAAQPLLIPCGAQADLSLYLGHCGLMEFTVDVPPPAGDRSAHATATFCCLSQRYFQPIMDSLKPQALVMTRSLMYPGAFLAQAVAEGWIHRQGKDAIRARVVAAYAKNQKITPARASTVFAP